MNVKVIVATVAILGSLFFGAVSFMETNVEYLDIAHARTSTRKVQVKGEWVREKETSYDVENNRFSFTMKDEAGSEMNVVYAGARPNNFELASSVVVKGTYEQGRFQASAILTKCPSKYEGMSPEAEQSPHAPETKPESKQPENLEK